MDLTILLRHGYREMLPDSALTDLVFAMPFSCRLTGWEG